MHVSSAIYLSRSISLLLIKQKNLTGDDVECGWRALAEPQENFVTRRAKKKNRLSRDSVRTHATYGNLEAFSVLYVFVLFWPQNGRVIKTLRDGEECLENFLSFDDRKDMEAELKLPK